MIKQRHLICIALIALIYITLKGSWLLFPRVFQTLELQAQDNLLRLAHSLGHRPRPSPDIVFIDLDDHSLEQIPYSKNDPELWGKVVTTLKKAGVAAQLVDMVFTSGYGTEYLASRIKEAGNVYLPIVFSHAAKTGLTGLPPSIFLPQTPGTVHFPVGKSVIGNTDDLHRAAADLGHINCWPDHDGVYRRLPLFFTTNKGLVPTLSLRVAADFLNVSGDSMRIQKDRLILPQATFPDGRTRDIAIPFDQQGRTRIPFAGPWPYTYAHYSVALLLEKGATAAGIMELQDELEHSIAIVSDVTTGGRDFGPVPFSAYSPLSDLHAQFVGGILTGNFLEDANSSQVLLLDLALVGLLIAFNFTVTGYRLVAAASIAVAILLAGSYGLLTFSSTFVPLALPLLLIVFGSVAMLAVQFVAIQQEKRVLKARLMPYFAPSVMEKILASPELLSTVAKKRLTILFSDIVGFSEWSSTREASEIHETLNRYFREMSEIIFSFEGTIDKFMGDGLLAFFGDPTPQDDHPRRAVQAALAMQQKAWQLKKEWALSGGMHIRIRIGIHTGEVVVGNMGSMERMDYTVIGSHVNLAQRLESNCAPDRVLISREVLELLDDNFITSANDTINAKGFSEPIEVHYVDRYQPVKTTTI